MPQSYPSETQHQDHVSYVFHQPDPRINACELYLSDNPTSPQNHLIRISINEYRKEITLKNLKKLVPWWKEE